MTSLELGIQENDLWIAAQALEYNLVLSPRTSCSEFERSLPSLRLRTGQLELPPHRLCLVQARPISSREWAE